MPPLSSREREVMHFASDGLTKRETASTVSVGQHRQVHFQAVYCKLGVNERRTAVRVVFGDRASCERPLPEGAPLTPRERGVLACVSAGMRNREIADALFLSIATVRSHIARASRRLGAHTRRDAVIAASFYGSQKLDEVLR